MVHLTFLYLQDMSLILIIVSFYLTPNILFLSTTFNWNCKLSQNNEHPLVGFWFATWTPLVRSCFPFAAPTSLACLSLFVAAFCTSKLSFVRVALGSPTCLLLLHSPQSFNHGHLNETNVEEVDLHCCLWSILRSRTVGTKGVVFVRMMSCYRVTSLLSNL